MDKEEIILDKLRNRCAQLQAFIYELRDKAPKTMDQKSIGYLETDLIKIKKQIHEKVYDYRLAQLDRELKDDDIEL